MSVTSHPSFPPKKKRKSRSSTMPWSPSAAYWGCERIYNTLFQKINQTAPFIVIWDGYAYTDIDKFYAAYSAIPERSPRQQCDSPGWAGGPVHYHLYIK
jgi:hypothetical protein